MEPESSWAFSKKIVTGAYTETDASSPNLSNFFIKDPF
jgi:hypothetical protein